jgi:hypothetical protein
MGRDDAAAAIVALVRARYAGTLSEVQLAELERRAAAQVEQSLALRAVPLENHDEPAFAASLGTPERP